MECPRAQPTLCLSLATLVPRAGRKRRTNANGGRLAFLGAFRLRLRGAGRNARVMQRDRRIVIPGEPTCETRDPNSRAISLLGPGSPKLRTRNFSGRDDKRWNSHAPTNSLLVACDSRSVEAASAAQAEPAASDGPTRTAAASSHAPCGRLPRGESQGATPTGRRETANANGGRLREVGVAVSKARKSGPAARAAKELFKKNCVPFDRSAATKCQVSAPPL